jgi:hypothetical protein
MRAHRTRSMCARKAFASAATERRALLHKLGITAEVQAKLDEAATAVRAAIELLGDACELAPDESDTLVRCQEAIGELEEALHHVEWKAPDGEQEAGS